MLGAGKGTKAETERGKKCEGGGRQRLKIWITDGKRDEGKGGGWWRAIIQGNVRVQRIMSWARLAMYG